MYYTVCVILHVLYIQMNGWRPCLSYLVTDDPKPPGPAELEQNVPGTVTVTWTPSPDEKKDDRLHYIVYKRDSVKRTWRMVADSLFNHKFTVINILPGREYNFRVFAKNDMGLSEPAVSPTWGTTRRKGLWRQQLASLHLLNERSLNRKTFSIGHITENTVSLKCCLYTKQY